MSADVVVIGAGLNGLVAAGYLARAGRRVVVLERRSVAGGAHVTTEFAPGFRCNEALDDAGWIPPRIVHDLDLAAHGLRLVLPGNRMLVPAGDGAWLSLRASPAETARELVRFSSADAAAWPAFAQRMSAMAGFLEKTYGDDAPNVDASSAADLLGLLHTGMGLRRMGKAAMVDLLRTAPMSAGELLDDVFTGDALKGALAAEGVRHLLQGPRSGGTSFVLLHHQVGRPAGVLWSHLVPDGGVGALADALVASVRAAGGEVRLNAPVARIAMRDGIATGVALASGEEIAARQVVSSADPRTTMLSLADPTQLPPELVRSVRNIRFKGAWAKVNLALDSLPVFPGVSADDLGDAAVLRVANSIAHVEHAYDDAKYGRQSELPWLDVRIPSLRESGFAPAGKHVLSVHVQFTPYHLRDGGWTDAARRTLGDRVVHMLDELAPGLASLVRHRQVLTPRDLETEFALPEGNAYHGEMTLDQVLFMRPVPECSRYATPVRNLFLCGSGSHPGGGIAGGAGANAARGVLKGPVATASRTR